MVVHGVKNLNVLVNVVHGVKNLNVLVNFAQVLKNLHALVNVVHGWSDESLCPIVYIVLDKQNFL